MYTTRLGAKSADRDSGTLQNIIYLSIRPRMVDFEHCCCCKNDNKKQQTCGTGCTRTLVLEELVVV